MNVRKKIGFLLLSAIVGGRLVSGAETKSGESVLLNASDFGVVADGRTDDGPAIGRMLSAINPGQPTVLAFPPKGIIYAKQVQNRFLFQLDQMEAVELDGNGSTFILDPSIRFLDMNGSQDMTVKRLNITFRPLPFVEGTITAVDADKGFVDVRLKSKDAPLPLGGPTGEDGENAFFALAWSSGTYGLISEHLWVEGIQRGPRLGTVRIKANGEALEGGRVVVGQGISLPVPGLAHRYGPGGCFDVNDSSRVLFEDVELWSAPWFGVRVFRNRDWVTFRRVHIRPRPGSDSTLSTWRDGFHVKGNFAKLLWEDCQLIGMGDDAFNISSHSSSVTKMIDPLKFEVRQRYCLDPMPWHENMHLVAADDQSKRILGEARIVGVTTRPNPAFAHLPDPAPISIIELD
ncbi:MAG: glycoside hydrolase family 55 protein, partial [Kiritimatiellales bacterium]|nr:glycoside hydrolase family 55 protein [Kiritimatiellales bacterium]